MPRLKKADPLARAIGRRVQELLAERNMRQEKLAYENDVPKATITNLIRGLSRPSIVTLHKIASGLGVELFDLFIDPARDDRHRLVDRTRSLNREGLRVVADAAEQAPRKKRGSPGF